MRKFAHPHAIQPVAALVLLCLTGHVATAAAPQVVNPTAPQFTVAGGSVLITVEGSWSSYPPASTDPDPGMDTPYLIDSAGGYVTSGAFQSGGFLPNSLIFRRTYIFWIPSGAAVGDKFRGKVDFLEIGGAGTLSATSLDFEVIPPAPQRSSNSVRKE
jgi:hypothetical protein